MKRGLILFLILISGIVAISGCTEPTTHEELLKEFNRSEGDVEYEVFLQDYTTLKNMTVKRAKDVVSPDSDDAEVGYSVIDYGETSIEGVKVYYGNYNLINENKIEGNVYFKINDRWYSLLWYDKIGNPNKKAIDDKIALIIRKAKNVE